MLIKMCKFNLYRFIVDDNVFTVMIVENDLAKKCGLAGEYHLIVNSIDMSLHNISDSKSLYSWPYRCVRRYGRTPRNFQFEAGRKCTSGK